MEAPKKIKQSLITWICWIQASQVVLLVKDMPASARDVRDSGSIPGLGRSLGGGHSNPLPVLLPGESHGQRSRQAAVHGVTQSGTRLSDLARMHMWKIP